MVGHVVAVHSCGIVDMPRLQACFRIDDHSFCGPSMVCLQRSAASAYPAGAHVMWQAILSLSESHTIHQHCYWSIVAAQTQPTSPNAQPTQRFLQWGSCSSTGLSKQHYTQGNAFVLNRCEAGMQQHSMEETHDGVQKQTAVSQPNAVDNFFKA